ncbi:serine protease [Kocuria dechangensis]|uniref:Serine protease n=1 Tax=Kocuria dechangensis TaxID=1176249 RepID=A0A917GKJ9_9MICC|nr:trypsin-like peptidase domain-containing protein [Kocuria dechangensis]GGG50077.1 serine protease [Kocuria dechangensis]
MSDHRDPRSGTDPQPTQPIPPVSARPDGGPWAPGGERGHWSGNGDRYGADAEDGTGWTRPVYGAGHEGGPGAGAPQQGWDGAPADPFGARPAERRRFSGASLVTGMALAALIGAGAAVGTDALLEDGQIGSAGGSTSTSSSIIVNDQDDVNAVTAAAQKASPSTVTISSSSGSEAGSGSGVIIDDQGHILTNTHVVTLDGTASDPELEVRLDDGSVHTATVVGTDPLSDLAVIKIEVQGLTPATLGSLDDVNVGDTAIAIGAPLGLSGTVTDGIVSTLDRTIEVASSAAPSTPSEGDGQDGNGGNDFFFNFPDDGGQGGGSRDAQSIVYLNVIQTDAAINPGNSGGPLIDTDGEVIGINVAIASAGSSAEAGNIGVGFSIPIDNAKRVAQEIIDNGRATHGYLGTSVTAAPAAEGRSQAFSDGAVIREVVAGSPADEAGLEVDDVITEFNGHRIQDANSLTAAVRELPAGGTGTVRYVRDGEERTAEVMVGDAADQE